MGEELGTHFSPDEVEWIVMGVAMMGFLNKMTDSLGIEIEQGAVDDVAALIEPTGWSMGQHAWGGATKPETAASVPTDSLKTLAKAAGNAPGAIRLEKEWMQGLPKKPEDARAFLLKNFGCDDTLLSRMNHTKPHQSLAAMLKQNLDADQSEIGIGRKTLAGLVFANHMENDYLIKQSKQLASFHGVDDDTLAAADSFLSGSTSSELETRTEAALHLATKIASSPTAIDDETLATVNETLSSAEIVEIIVWVAVNQLQHRLSLFYQC